MSATSIEWATHVWNPVTGCDRVSPGCAHCYALDLAPRLRAMHQARGGGKWADAPDGGKTSGPAFGVQLHPDVLDEPLTWRKPRRVFVNSMSDLFHDEIPSDYIATVFGRMAAASQHTFMVLTKRPERMRDLLRHPEFDRQMRTASGELGHELPLRNVWLGVSIENRRYADRADILRDTPAALRFVSAEPLLGPLLADEAFGFGVDARVWSDGYEGPELDLEAIDWLIVGGESGPRHRPIRPEWVRALRDECSPFCSACTGTGLADLTEPQSGACSDCNGAGHFRLTAFFFKQWGGRTPKAGGRELDGRTWDEIPARRERLGDASVEVSRPPERDRYVREQKLELDPLGPIERGQGRRT